MRISDWSSDVCSSDLQSDEGQWRGADRPARRTGADRGGDGAGAVAEGSARQMEGVRPGHRTGRERQGRLSHRSEEHTSELQSLMRISYAVFCLKKNKQKEIVHESTTDETKPLAITNTTQ